MKCEYFTNGGFNDILRHAKTPRHKQQASVSKLD